MLSQGRFLVLGVFILFCFTVFILFLFSFSCTFQILCIHIMTWDSWVQTRVSVYLDVFLHFFLLWLFILFSCFIIFRLACFDRSHFILLLFLKCLLVFYQKTENWWIQMGIEIKKKCKGWREGKHHQYTVWKSSYFNKININKLSD